MPPASAQKDAPASFFLPGWYTAPMSSTPASTAMRFDAPGHPPATITEFEGVRSLHLGTSWVQGAMRLSQPDAIELEYVQMMMIFWSI